MANVSGVQPGYTNGGLSDAFQVRGFQTLNFYRDGFLLRQDSVAVQPSVKPLI